MNSWLSIFASVCLCDVHSYISIFAGTERDFAGLGLFVIYKKLLKNIQRLSVIEKKFRKAVLCSREPQTVRLLF